MEIATLAALELNSIAVGFQVLDGMVKAGPIQIVDAKTICPGKFVILVTGEVAAVDSALSKGKEIGEGCIVDELFIPNLHPQIKPAIIGTIECEIWDAIAMVESFSVTASISAADTAAKTADILINEIRLAAGMGGKSYLKMIGDIYEVEAAVHAAVEVIKKKGLLCKEVIIPNPHPDIQSYFVL